MITNQLSSPRSIAKSLLLTTLAALPLCAAVLPVDLPDPDPADTGVKNKPVKVYIQSGQSNSLGFGRIEGAAPFYSRVFLSADPSVTEGTLPGENTAILRFGVFQSGEAGAKPGGLADGKPVALGMTKATIAAGQVKAWLEVPLDGTYEVNLGLGESREAAAQIDGKPAYNQSPEGKPVITPVRLEKGKRYPLVIDYMTPTSGALWLEKVDLKGIGDLKFVVTELGRFPQLIDNDGKWTERKDVMLNNAYMGKGVSKPMSPGTIGKAFGPELGFGYVMGTFQPGTGQTRCRSGQPTRQGDRLLSTHRHRGLPMAAHRPGNAPRRMAVSQLRPC